MSINVSWEFGAPDADARETVVTEPLLLNFFEIYPEDYQDEERTNLENSAIYPKFVRGWEKHRDFVPISYEEGLKYLEENGGAHYVGPSIDPSDVEAWALAWIEILSDGDDEIKRAFGLQESGFDWTAATLDDLRRVHRAAARALATQLSAHIEVY